MILVYLIFCIVIGLINRKTNVIFALILGIFGLNFFLNGNSIIGGIQTLITVPRVMLQNPQAVFLVIIIILLFILSNLLNLINIDFLVDRYVGKFSPRRQQIITFFISFLSTNLDLSNSDIGKHHSKVFDINSWIMPFLNPFSIIVIFTSSLLVMFDTVNGVTTLVASLIIIMNIPALWWAFKTLVSLVYRKNPNYEINEYNMNLIRPSIKVEQSRAVQTTLNGKRFIKRCIQLSLFAIVIGLTSPSYKIYIAIISYLLILITYVIYLGVKAVYEERIMAEEEIYRTIRNSVLGMGPELVSFLLTLIFTSLSYDYIAKFYANIYSIEQLFILSLIGLLIGMILFKDYLIGISMALPITLIWATSNYSIDFAAIQSLYIVLVSLATLIQIFYLIDFKKVGRKERIDLMILSLVTGSQLIMIYLIGLEAGITLFAIEAISYLIYHMISAKKVKNDNPRHT